MSDMANSHLSFGVFKVKNCNKLLYLCFVFAPIFIYFRVKKKIKNSEKCVFISLKKIFFYLFCHLIAVLL